MTTEKKCTDCTLPEIVPPTQPPALPLEKGKMSKPIEAALDAVENIGKLKKV